MAEGDSKPSEQPSPKLSVKDYRVYNSMAEHMEYFHSNFRQSWKVLYSACETGKRPGNISLRQYLATGMQFCHHLHIHHSIEEQHIFPVLAMKMPAFRKELELLTQHKLIHEGLEKLQAYLEDCTTGERELRLEEMKRIMDGFGEVLWAHLSDEENQLKAENMRNFWTLEEMKRMPM